ncbi:hypothetical protein OD91_1721 [Lutibacter sp. Hel_I_33_5]|uniref:MbnP family protein n=1 Tax=Lutibacter sp. Hel_I_33_5 TaxID=1566289 RepID=UPI0011A03481|nr:MbnP family protein [Lutibacter sp. Hel_I_33_5]TVZ56436.1 hypothetical protein OD91_1721 [Lutibacter sp. Hel_I_33_5]
MRNSILLFLILIITFNACSSDNDIPIINAKITLNFTHHWDETPVTNEDFNSIKFTTKNGEQLSIERLRYVISNVLLTDAKNNIDTLSNYHLINIGENSGLSYESPKTVHPGIYDLTFIFGFKDADNVDSAYKDLNTANFNVPAMLGGGYHFMQFDGKYKDTNIQDSNFNYHAIRAVDRTDPNNLKFQDTSIAVDLGEVIIDNNASIEIKMNIAEWFKNPNTWDLNVLNTVLMPNFDAQKMMSENGEGVFSLGEITQN